MEDQRHTINLLIIKRNVSMLLFCVEHFCKQKYAFPTISAKEIISIPIQSLVYPKDMVRNCNNFQESQRIQPFPHGNFWETPHFRKCATECSTHIGSLLIIYWRLFKINHMQIPIISDVNPAFPKICIRVHVWNCHVP